MYEVRMYNWLGEEVDNQKIKTARRAVEYAYSYLLTHGRDDLVCHISVECKSGLFIAKLNDIRLYNLMQLESALVDKFL